MITLVASLIAVDNNFFVTSFDGDFAFRSLGRKISLQIENDDQIDFDDLGNEDDEEEEEETTNNPRRESRGVSQVGYPKVCWCYRLLTRFFFAIKILLGLKVEEDKHANSCESL